MRMDFESPSLSKRSRNRLHSLPTLINICFVESTAEVLHRYCIDARIFNLNIKSEVPHLLTYVACSLLMPEYWLFTHIFMQTTYY